MTIKSNPPTFDPAKLSEQDWANLKGEFDAFLRDPGSTVEEAFCKLEHGDTPDTACPP